MCEVIPRDVTNSELHEVVNKQIPDSIAKDIEKVCHGIYLLTNVCIRKFTLYLHLQRMLTFHVRCSITNDNVYLLCTKTAMNVILNWYT
ncbi:unnamed protein product [Spodoptera exigua]|nr:unnamed protein product [Spodoptera exigua]